MLMKLLPIALSLNIVCAIDAADQTCVHIHYPSIHTPSIPNMTKNLKTAEFNSLTSHISMPIDVVNIIEDYDDTSSRSKSYCGLIATGCTIFVISAGSYIAPFSGTNDNKSVAHLYFGASAGVTVSGYVMETAYMLYKRDQARIRQRLAVLSDTGARRQRTLRSTIGRGLKKLGELSFALGAPLLPMGIGWGAGVALATPERAPSIATEIKISKYSFLLGNGLMAAGTMLWLSGNELSRE